MGAKRILDHDRVGLVSLSGRGLDAAIRAAEGRTVIAEVFANSTGIADGCHNAEVQAAHGADIVILNFIEQSWDGEGMFRFDAPDLTTRDLRAFAEFVGRPIAVNIEPGDVPAPRRASVEGGKRLVDAGAAALVLTANPWTDSDYASLVRVTAELRAGLGDDVALWSGKMHGAGVHELPTPDVVRALAEAGASGVLVPMPGTVPGVTIDVAARAVDAIHAAGAFALGTIGTSQEGSPAEVAVRFAIDGKQAGFDAFHIGDSWAYGSGDPDVVRAISLAIRGKRHTWRRMALGARPRP